MGSFVEVAMHRQTDDAAAQSIAVGCGRGRKAGIGSLTAERDRIIDSRRNPRVLQIGLQLGLVVDLDGVLRPHRLRALDDARRADAVAGETGVVAAINSLALHGLTA